MAYQPRSAIIGQLVSMAAQEADNLGLQCLRQQRSRAVSATPGQPPTARALPPKLVAQRGHIRRRSGVNIERRLTASA